MNQVNEMPGLKIRHIETDDNAMVADIIRVVMTEFQAVGCGYSINDSEIDNMHSAYALEGSAFYVVTVDDRIMGCGGFGPLAGADPETCELRKMYFKPEIRGRGVGAKLLSLCLEESKRVGFKRCYLETMDNMERAQRLYGKHGFEYLDQPMGNTGHSSCGTWMVKQL